MFSGAANVGLNLFFVVALHMGVAGVAIATDIFAALSALLVRTQPTQPPDAANAPLCTLEETNADGSVTQVTVWLDGKDIIFASSTDAQHYRVPGAAAEFCRLTGLPEGGT